MMFFKKKAVENPIQANNEDKPIYILGDGALAQYFAAKLTILGHKARLLTSEATAKKEKEITFKEEYSLQKQTLLLQLVSRIKEEPQLIIIASEQHNLRANLSLLPSTRYPNTPIICFNQIENLKLLRPLFGTNFCKAYFNGYLYLSGATLSLCGPEPKITLSVTEKNNQPHPSQELLTGLGFSCTCQGNDTLNFWQNNAEPIIGYLASRPKQHIAELLKADDTKTDLMQAIKEIITLAKHEKVKLSAENIIRRFLETPKGFYYKNNEISKTETAFILDRLYNTLSQKSHLYKCKISKINQFIKQNYDDLLKK